MLWLLADSNHPGGFHVSVGIENKSSQFWQQKSSCTLSPHLSIDNAHYQKVFTCSYLPDSLLLNLVLANLLLDLVSHILWSTVAKAATFLRPLVSTPRLMSTGSVWWKSDHVISYQWCYFMRKKPISWVSLSQLLESVRQTLPCFYNLPPPSMPPLVFSYSFLNSLPPSLPWLGEGKMGRLLWLPLQSLGVYFCYVPCVRVSFYYNTLR